MKITVSKTITSLLAVTLLTTVAITNSGLKFVPVHKAEAAATQTVQSAADIISSTATVMDGVAKLLETAMQLREAAMVGDEAKIKEYGPELEESWSKIEDEIKPQYPAFYEQVERFLNPAVAGSQDSSIDKDAILKLDDQLIKVLNDLSKNLIEADQVKVGATKLIDVANDMKLAIDAGDEAKIKEIGPKLEEMWSTFEDSVKPRNADLYEEIEKNLNPEVAGAQKTPIDTQKLVQLNDNLIKVVTKLLQSQK